MLISALLASFIVSLLSLFGIFFLFLKKKALDKILFYLVGFSAGALIGGAFIHLIPEAAEGLGFSDVGLWVIIGFALFFIIERGLHWHHCHKHSGECKVHLFSYMNLLGDGVHNFTDGLAIAVSFLSSTNLGVATTLAVMAHEIPQEISDFGVLVYGGFSKKKALFFNFLSAVMALIGVVVGFFLATGIEYFANYILAFAAGGFIYIAASDLIPELHKEEKLSQSVVSFVFFALGVGFMLLTKLLFEH